MINSCSEKIILEGEIVYVPVVRIIHALGYEAERNLVSNTVLLKVGRKKVVLTIGQSTGSLNNFEITLEAPVKDLEGQIVVPVTFLTDIFNLKTEVDKNNELVLVSEKEKRCPSKQLIFFHEELMQQTKADINSGDDFYIQAFQKVKGEADIFMKEPMDSVVNKLMMPPSGDKHDYLSIAPYFWPDEESETGYPWKPNDGQINPKSRGVDTDFVRTSTLLVGIEKICLTYYYCEDKKYLEKALECIQAWFIDEDTRMNPSVKYGQSVPGGIDGRPLGVIEWTVVVNVVTALQLLERNEMISQKELDVMADWFTAYISWLQRSTIGIDEDEQRNNHGSNYDYQLAGILLYLGHYDEAVKRLESVKTRRIADYIQPDGSQPFELRRTKSMNYNSMNLRVLTKVADLAKRFTDVDLWNYETEDGRSLKKAYAFLKPYILKEKDWEWQQIQETVDIKLANTMRPLFLNAKNLFGDAFLDFPDDLAVSVPAFDSLRFHMKSPENDEDIVWKIYQI